MTILRIDNFGGEVPRVSARALPLGTSTVNKNLLATSTEFRPLLGDSTVAAAPVGAKSLYRLSRNADGTLRSDDTTGWLAELADKSYVKGQLNDDNTERTYVSFNDGTLPLRVVNASGQDRQLGVTPPTGLTLLHNKVSQFTLSDANAWADGTLLPALLTAITTGVVYTDPVSRVAGPRSNYGLALPAYPTSQRGVTEPWNLLYSLSNADAKAKGLDDAQLAGIVQGTTLILGINALPMWGTIPNATALKARIRVLLNPKDGSQLFSDERIEKLATTILDRYDVNGDEVARLRDSLDDAVKEFRAALDFVLAQVETNPKTRPNTPAPPEWLTDSAGNITGRNPTWDAYDNAQADYTTGKGRVSDSKTNNAGDKVARLSAMVAAQATALQVCKSIELLYTQRADGLESWVKDFITQNLVQSDYSPDGLVKVDPDRVIDTRFYIATFVTDWGEESAPSTIDLENDKLDVDQNDSVTVTVAQPSGTNAANIKKWRLYRSNSGSNTAAFQFVDEMLIQTLTYVDSLEGSQLGEVCPTTTWAEPPVRRDNTSTSTTKPIKGLDPYLRGLVGMPNGINAGFMDNFVAFCEPYIPYAWPVEYQITTEFPIVGLGVFGQSLFVGTLGNPYIISGSDSASMSAQKLDANQACASRRSIVAVDGGVLYASPDGICFASNGGVQNVTENLFSREDWQKLDPRSIVAAFFEGVYYFWYQGNAGGCYALDTNAKKLGRVDMAATCVFSDILTDAVFYVQGGNIKRAFSTSRRVGQWTSGIAVMPKQTALAWLQVDGDQSPAAPATIEWYGDGALQYSVSVGSIEPVRLPPGRYLEHQISVLSTARITKVMLASSTAELQAS